MQSRKNTSDGIQEWPADGLESVPHCPVCGAANRELLHENLTDRIFFCAPGKWSMYRCRSCASAYIDPRPTLETIGLAYEHYVTHSLPGFASFSFLNKLRRRFANGYRNFRFGTRDSPASYLGILAAGLMPNGRAVIDAGMRHLPDVSAGNRLLDLGCGSGAFLKRARSAGWEVVGVDFDAKAVEVARGEGLDVHLGGVDLLNPTEQQFDVITLSHVIEHVHDPVAVLKACCSLLKPDGLLWLETPNIDSEGHRLFGENWRGLEPPRHLVLFTMKSMLDSLNAAGFENVEIQPYRPLCASLFAASGAIKDGVDPYLKARRNKVSDSVKKAEKIAKRNPELREFLTIKAWR